MSYFNLALELLSRRRLAPQLGNLSHGKSPGANDAESVRAHVLDQTWDPRAIVHHLRSASYRIPWLSAQFRHLRSHCLQSPCVPITPSAWKGVTTRSILFSSKSVKHSTASRLPDRRNHTRLSFESRRPSGSASAHASRYVGAANCEMRRRSGLGSLCGGAAWCITLLRLYTAAGKGGAR